MIQILRPPGLGAITSQAMLNYEINAGEQITALAPDGETLRVRAFVKEAGADLSIIVAESAPLRYRARRIRTSSLTRLP